MVRNSHIYQSHSKTYIYQAQKQRLNKQIRQSFTHMHAISIICIISAEKQKVWVIGIHKIFYFEWIIVSLSEVMICSFSLWLISLNHSSKDISVFLVISLLYFPLHLSLSLHIHSPFRSLLSLDTVSNIIYSTILREGCIISFRTCAN